MDICIDFDGTVVTHEYPKIGQPVEGALRTLRELRSKGHRLILFTMRSGQGLQEAVEYLETSGVQLFGINVNPEQIEWTTSNKAYGQLYIDDAGIGTKLISPEQGRPYVDWQWVREQLLARGIL